MANGQNLKLGVQADTADFKKGMKEVIQSAQDMGKEVGGVMNGFSNAMGVSTGALRTLVDNLRNATNVAMTFGSKGTESMSKFQVALRGVTGAIAGLGLASAVAMMKELNAEVKNYQERGEGLNMSAAGAAYRDTFRQSLYDATGAGEKMSNFWEKTKTAASMAVTSIFTVGRTTQEQRTKALQDASRASELAAENVDLQREQIAQSVTIARYQNDINEQLEIAKNTSLTKAERDAAQAKAVELTNQKYAIQIDLAERLRDNALEMGELASNTLDDDRNEAQLTADVLNLQAQQKQELTSLNKLGNSIAKASSDNAKAAKTTTEETRLTLDLARQQLEVERQRADLKKANDAMMAVARFQADGPLQALPGISGQASQLKVTVPIKPVIEERDLVDLSDNINDLLESSFVSLGSSIGSMVADLATGGDALGNFRDAAISAFGDLAVTVGKMAIQTGIATLGIKKALESLNPYVAIAAGTALVALGTAVKAGLSNVASGSYSSSSVASSSYSSTDTSRNGNTPFGRELTLKVTGTLTGEGSKLKAVINNDDRRNNVTT